uniref:Apolipoprotein A-IV a n=1 Tax=Sinocyclocheilus anshuiensis TaxID=1608454 RepID=A0A671Q9R7_9TELE
MILHLKSTQILVKMTNVNFTMKMKCITTFVHPSAELQAQLEPYTAEIKEKVDQHLQEFQKTVTPLAEDLQAQIRERAQMVQQSLTPYAEDLKEKLDPYAQDLQAQLTSLYESFVKRN